MNGRAPLLVVLDGCHLDGHQLGAKAASLDRLIAIGLPVPACAVITSTAYRLSVVDGRLRDALDALRTTPIPPPEEHPARRRAIDQLFLDAPLPRVVRTMIARLASWTADRPGGRVAVRSSATAEDLDAASFAGQYRTTLDVSADDVERAVRLTWASLWHPGPRTYRAHHGIGDDVEMAVLAMEMIDPVSAGVLFTRDPIGNIDDVRIESVAGLGELLVSGARTPEALVIPRAGAVGAAGDVDPALRELVTTSLDLERRLGRPQDIEWAVDHEHRLWFLQARPITTLGQRDAEPRDRSLDDGFDIRPPGSPALTTAGIGEMVPGVVPPLVWEAVSRQLEGGFRTLFADLGAPLDDLERPHALVARVHGRAALDLDRMRDAAASIPGGSADELERRYFGVAVTDAAGRAPTKRAGPWHGVRILTDRRRAVVESEIVTRAVARVHRAEPPLAAIGDDQLLALRARVLDLADRVAAAEIAVAALAAAAHRSVESMLHGRLGDAAVAVAHDATAPTPGTGLHHGDDDPVTLDLGELDDTMRTIITEAGAIDLDWQSARAALGATLAGRTAISRWESLLARSGSTSIFAGPTWADAPELAWLDLCAHLRRDRPGSHAPAPRSARERTQAAIDAVMAGGHPVGSVRRRFLRREIDDARELLDRRERTKSALLVLGGFARRLDDELGRRLVERHRCEFVDDVRLLTTAEVTTLLREVGGPSWSVIALRRRRHAAATEARPLPRLFRGRPEQPVDVTGGRAPDDAADAPVFGWAASPGRYEGPARVLTSPTSTALRRGEVIVARATDASWAPLFLVAGAIVVEEGGPLSHAAIIARELGVPAVVNTPGIVDLVTAAGDGAHLTVDGTTGAVRLHTADPLDELPIAPPRTPPSELDLGRLGVFVTGLIGAGVLMSALVSITESVGSGSGARRALRQSAGAAVNVADAVLHGTDRTGRSTAGLRTATWYASAAVIATAVAALTLHVGLDRWLDGGDWAGLWLAFGLTGTLPAAAALALLSAADRWPEVPPVVRRHLGAATDDGRTRWWLLPRAHRGVITALAALVGILLVTAVVAEDVLLAIDRPIYDATDANRYADPWSPHWFGIYFGRPQVVIPIAIVVALFTLRCRVLALAYPLAIVFGGVVNMGIGHLVGRRRPPLSNHWYQSDSFPSGHAIEVTLLLGLAPLAVAVLFRRRWVGHVVRVIATAVLALMLVDGVRDGSHWLSDHVAGFALALIAVVFVHALARTPELHRTCRDCPAMAIAARRERPEESP